MKTLKLTKLLSLVLACVLLMGAFGTLPVFAADSDATIEIVGKNIAFRDTISLAYRVECSDPDAEIEVLLYDAEGTLLGTATKTVYEVDGVEKVCYISAGVPAHKIDTVITAVATIKGTDIKSAPVEYSVLEYLYERLEVDAKAENTDVTAEQIAMYKALMDYAIASELVLEEVKDGEEPDRISDYTYFAIAEEGKDVDGKIVKKNTKIPAADFVTDLVPKEGYELVWYFNGVKTELPEEFYEIKDATVVEPVIEEIPTAPPTWQLVTDVSKLAVGTKIVIAAATADKAMSTVQNSNNRGIVDFNKSTVVGSEDEALNDFTDVQIITLYAGDSTGTFAFYVEGTETGYLHAASASKNYLRTQSAIDANASWKIEITEDGVATIKAQGSNTRNMILYNPGNSLFSCYSVISNQTAEVCIYAYY